MTHSPSAGIFFASPLREPMILQEKLPFPSGSATAQLVSLLHRTPLKRNPIPVSEPVQGTEEGSGVALPSDVSNDEVKRSWAVLIGSLALSCTVTLASFFVPVLYALPVFDLLSPPGDSLTRWGWWFTPSFSYIGQGMIMGLPTSVHMVLGALVGWGILSPLAHHFHWTQGEPLDPEDGGRGWILWVSVAVMCAESIIGVVTLIISSGTRDFTDWWSGAEQRAGERERLMNDANASDVTLPEDDDEPPHRKTPMSWVVGGLIISSIVGVIAVAGAVGSHIAAWATFVAFILASLFSVLAVRALGETDLNPVSGVAKISQLLYGALQPGNVVANLIAGAIAESGAMQAGELMQDYKTGHLVGVAPWNQFRGQLLGSLLGIAFTVFGYSIYRSTYPIPGPQFPAPTATIWLNLARLINQGTLPSTVPTFMLLFFVLFGVTGILHAIARSRRLRRERSPRRRHEPAAMWEHCALAFPSGIAFATGIMNTPNFSLARLLGGIGAAWYARYVQRKKVSNELGQLLVIVVASGFVLGEGFASIAGLMLTSNNAQPLTCYGCRYGCAGGC